MQLRNFGNTGLEISPITFGAMRMTEDPEGSTSALYYALENGINFIDTARNYQGSEELLGKALQEWTGPRPYLSTKVKPKDISNWRYFVELDHQFTPRSIQESVEESLRLLGIDTVDFLQLHQWYYLWRYHPIWNDILSTIDQLKSSGKIRYFGVSAQDHEHDALLGLMDHQEIEGAQMVLNIFESKPLVSAIPFAEQKGVGVIGRCIFDHSGALATGGSEEMLLKDVKLSKATSEIRNEYLSRIHNIKQTYAEKGISLPELSIRFGLSHPGVSTLAISLANREHVDLAIQAASKGALSTEDMTDLCQNHIWVKNFYYFSRATVDGNK